MEPERKEDEQKAWDLLIRSRINPSQWNYTGTLTTPDGRRHTFKNINTRQEMTLAEREENGRKNNRTFFWHAPSLNTDESHYHHGERAGLQGR